MKINWGISIAIFYTSFMVVLLYFVFKTRDYDHSLVMDNYYEQDLKYQQHYDKMENNLSLKEELQIRYDGRQGEIILHFPEAMKDVEGQVLFFRPSTSKLDFTKAINLDEQYTMRVSTREVQTGRWTIKVDWTAGGNTYFKTSEIVL
ncbi:MAG: FixH family protein [Bacteroidota bacterium]